MLQVSTQLSEVNGKQALDRLQLEQDLAFYDYVGAIGRTDQSAIKGDSDWHFALDRKSVALQSMDHARSVSALEQSRTKTSMNSECAGKAGLRNIPVIRIQYLSTLPCRTL